MCGVLCCCAVLCCVVCCVVLRCCEQKHLSIYISLDHFFVTGASPLGTSELDEVGEDGERRFGLDFAIEWNVWLPVEDQQIER